MFLDSELLVKFRTFKTWVGRCHVTRDKWHVKSPWASIDPSYLEFVKGMSCLASGPIDKIWGVEQFLTFYPQRPKLNQKKCLECRELILFVQSVTLSGVLLIAAKAECTARHLQQVKLVQKKRPHYEEAAAAVSPTCPMFLGP